MPVFILWHWGLSPEVPYYWSTPSSLWSLIFILRQGLMKLLRLGMNLGTLWSSRLICAFSVILCLPQAEEETINCQIAQRHKFVGCNSIGTPWPQFASRELLMLLGTKIMVICEHVQEALIICKAWRYFDSSKILYGSNKKMRTVKIISIKSVFMLKSHLSFTGFAWCSSCCVINWDTVPLWQVFVSEPRYDIGCAL